LADFATLAMEDPTLSNIDYICAATWLASVRDALSVRLESW
jgi:hypothetical protein